MTSEIAQLRTKIWQQVVGVEDPPEDVVAFLRGTYASSTFGGDGEQSDQTELVRNLLLKIGEDVEEDVSEYLEADRPTKLFYEAIIAFLERDSQSAGDDGEEGPEAGDDDDGTNAFSPVDATAKTFGLDTLYNLIDTGSLDLNPPWQRTVVWSPARQRELIKSILLGIPIPSIILHHQNAGQLGRERYSIIDGKQRLTAICGFLQNKFKLPGFKVDAEHPLYPCRNRWYDKTGNHRGLEPAYRTRIVTTQIPVLLFRDVPEGRLRQIFNLYNVTSTRLNAAEIRNAVYQRNPIHQMLFGLAGEPGGGQLQYLTQDEQQRFTSTLHSVLPSVKRYFPLDFLSRYMGYSRAATAEVERPFRAVTSSVAINRYLDIASSNDDPETICREIVRVFTRAPEFFDLQDDGEDTHQAFFTRDRAGVRRFEALQAVTSMVCTRLLDRVEALGAADRVAIDAAIRTSIQTVAYPDKQQYSTIWSHQAGRFLCLVKELGLDLDTFDEGRFKTFAARMTQVRIDVD